MSHVKHLFILLKNPFVTHIVQMSADLLPSELLFSARSQRGSASPQDGVVKVV